MWNAGSWYVQLQLINCKFNWMGKEFVHTKCQKKKTHTHLITKLTSVVKKCVQSTKE